MGDGGFCKHTAALLLTWLHDPDAFQEGEAPADALQQREKADLILLIRQMIARYPELEELIDLFPAGSADAEAPADPDLIRRQVEHAFRSGDYGYDDYGAAADIAAEVESIMQQAEAYQTRGRWGEAATVYRTVLETLLSLDAHTYDHDGELHAILWDGCRQLGTCLSQIDDPPARRAILRTLVDLIIQDITLGGYGFADEAYEIVLNQATDGEKAQIVAWVEAAADAYEPGRYDSGWRRGAFGGLLIDLQADSLSDEAFIDICRRTDRYEDLIRRLLELERIDEAITATRDASDYTLLSLADLFVHHNHGQFAGDLIWERAGTSNDARLEQWLQARAVAGGDWQQAVTHAENLFRQRPTLERYREIKAFAGHLGDWDQRREQILAALTAREAFSC